jgi:hypothetical protein
MIALVLTFAAIAMGVARLLAVLRVLDKGGPAGGRGQANEDEDEDEGYDEAFLSIRSCSPR